MGGLACPLLRINYAQLMLVSMLCYYYFYDFYYYYDYYCYYK